MNKWKVIIRLLGLVIVFPMSLCTYLVVAYWFPHFQFKPMFQFAFIFFMMGLATGMLFAIFILAVHRIEDYMIKRINIQPPPDLPGHTEDENE